MKERPRVTVLALVAALAAVAGVGGGVGLHLVLARSAPTARPPALPALHGQAVWPAGRRPAPQFALRDQNGALVSLRAQRGRSALIAFMDPLCRQECPIEGRALAMTEREVAPADRATLLIVSVNPAASGRDARAASRRWGLSPGAHWLLGTHAQLARVWRAYAIEVLPRSHDIAHSTALYLVDRRGDERVGVIAPFLPQFLADDLRVLAREAA